MNMTVLVVLACLSTDGNTCREVNFSFAAESLSVLQCQQTAHMNPKLVQWVSKNPGLVPKEWKCVDVSKMEREV